MSLSTAWTVFFYGWLVTEIYVAIATRTRKGAGKVSDRGTMLLLWLVIFGSITAGLAISGTWGPNPPGLQNAHTIKTAIKTVALVILIFALVLRWVSIISLGKSFSANVAVREKQTVYKKGLYRWVRHPSYTGLGLCFVATGLHTLNWISLAIIVVFPSAALLYRIHVEETALREAFGDEYVNYIRETKRLIPGIF